MVQTQVNSESSPAGVEACSQSNQNRARSDSDVGAWQAKPDEAGDPNPPRVSEAKLAANRRNAQRSTGPTSPEGKGRSSQNSFKHGLYAQQLVIPGENAAELDEVRASLRADHQPINETEEILVNEMAENFWRIRRMRRYEALAIQPENFDSCMDRLPIITRIMTAAERAFHRALRTLRQLQKERGFVSQKAVDPEPATASNNGFVSQNVSDPEPATASNRGFVPQNDPISPGHDGALDEFGYPSPDIGDEEASAAHIISDWN